MTTLTFTPGRSRVRGAPRAAKSPSRDKTREAPPALNPAKRNFIPSPYLDRWENEGGTWLDEHSIPFNS